MKAMIFAAGLGSRLQQLTANCPKALVKVDNHTLLELVLHKLRLSGFTDIVINVHHFPDQIIDFVNHYVQTYPMKIRISDERDLLLDTGGGLRKAFPLFLSNDADNEPILIHNVDILSNVQLSPLYEQCRSHDVLLLVSKRQTKRYLLFSDEMRMVGWTNIETGEIKTPYAHLDITKCSRFAFSGIQVVSPRIYERMKTWPERFGIMDFYINECATIDICGAVQPDLQLMDVGKPDTIIQAASFIEKYASD